MHRPTSSSSELPSDERLSVFVGGPLQHLRSGENSDLVIAEFRSIVKSLLDTGHEIFSAHDIEDYGLLSDDFTPKAVTDRDFAWARACDVYVAILPSDTARVPYRTDGTHIEIGWVTALEKRVIFVLSDDAERPYSHLIYGLVEAGYASMTTMAKWRDELLELVVATPRMKIAASRSPGHRTPPGRDEAGQPAQ